MSTKETEKNLGVGDAFLDDRLACLVVVVTSNITNKQISGAVGDVNDGVRLKFVPIVGTATTKEIIIMIIK